MNTAPEPSILWGGGSFRDGFRAPRVLFAQVHEDSRVECAAMSELPRVKHAVSIASGGCTALAMLTRAPDKLTVVDINPAQIHLWELKSVSYRRLEHGEVLEAWGSDAREIYRNLRLDLSEVSRCYWDSNIATLSRGIGNCGLLERALRRGLKLFRLLIHGRRDIKRLLTLGNAELQHDFYKKVWNSRRWRLLFHLALNRRVLRIVYGRKFTEHIPNDFSSRMRSQFEKVLTEFPLAINPYAWLAFTRRIPEETEGLPIALRSEHHSAIRDALPSVSAVHSEIAEWLGRQAARSIDFVALSNILEVSSDEYAARLSDALAHACTPGAIIVTRSIFPRDSDSPVHPRLCHDRMLSEKMAGLDRSLFCRNIAIFRAQ